MKLAVNDFYNYRPASQWAFDVAFSDVCLLSEKSKINGVYQPMATGVLTDEDLLRIRQSVVTVTQPKFSITPNIKNYGHFDFPIPIYDTNDIRLTVTFEDTDDCLISFKLLAALSGNLVTPKEIPVWTNVHAGIFIRLYEYDTYNLDLTRPNTKSAQRANYNTTAVKYYYCKLIENTEPNYNRNSESPSAATLKLTFLSVPVLTYVVDTSAVTATEPSVVNVTELLEKYWENSKNLVKSLDKFIESASNDAYKRFKNSNFAELAAQYKEWAKQKGKKYMTPTYATIGEWVRDAKPLAHDGKEFFTDQAQGVCAAGVSWTYALLRTLQGDQTAAYTPMGNGSSWGKNVENIDSNTKKNQSFTDIETAKHNLQNGQSFIVRMKDKTGENEFGHVVIISRDNNGKLMSTSDSIQDNWSTGWRAYKDSSKYEYDVIDLDKNYNPIAGHKY